MPRLYRQAPLNSIWEGSGNIMCLDVLRALKKHPRTLEALETELAPAIRGSEALRRYASRLMSELAHPDMLETRARRIVEGIALALQAAILVQHAPDAIARAFCTSRLDGNGGQTFGTLPAATDFGAILARAWPR
jgi:putative acyl-CoA dehydrogenase